MTQRQTPPFRADHVGSFLRPKYLLDAREQAARGEISREALRAVEDRAITEIVQFQRDCGLQSITDGEFRRTYFVGPEQPVFSAPPATVLSRPEWLPRWRRM